MIWTDLCKIVEENQTFLISSHRSQDGDCVGAQLAFYWYLSSLGKQVDIFNFDPLPKKFSFFENSDKISGELPTKKYDVLAILDASNPSRVGWDGIMESADKFINIDHHRDNSLFGTVNSVDITAAATCQIIYRFFNENNIDFPPFVADALFGGIISDTGGFQFSNTNREIFEIAANLVDRGADNPYVYKKLFASRSIAGLSVRSQIWSTLTFYADNRIGVMEVDEAMLDEYGADRGDIEGMSNEAMTAEGVEVGLFVKKRDDFVHCSLRSVGNIDVGAIAATVSGGGGHACASGCSIPNKTIEEAKMQIIAEIEKVLP